MPPQVKLGRKGQRIYDRLRKEGYTASQAHDVAHTHTVADALGLGITWDENEGGEWIVVATGTDGEVLDSMGGVDLGEVGPDAHHSMPYQYDAEAQVLSAAIDIIEDSPRRNPGRDSRHDTVPPGGPKR